MKYHSFDPKVERRRVEREQRRRDAAAQAQAQRAEALLALRQSLAQHETSTTPAPKTRKLKKIRNTDTVEEIKELVSFIAQCLFDEIKIIKSETGSYRKLRSLPSVKARAMTLVSARHFGFLFEESVAAKARLNKVLRNLNGEVSEETVLNCVAGVFVACDIKMRIEARKVLNAAPANLRKEVVEGFNAVRKNRKNKPRDLSKRHMRSLGYSREKLT